MGDQRERVLSIKLGRAMAVTFVTLIVFVSGLAATAYAQLAELKDGLAVAKDAERMGLVGVLTFLCVVAIGALGYVSKQVLELQRENTKERTLDREDRAKDRAVWSSEVDATHRIARALEKIVPQIKEHLPDKS